MGRKIGDWINAYLDYTALQEAPDRVHFWTALAILSAALRNRVWIDMEVYNLYANLYVCIVGDSAKTRRSIGTGMGFSLWKDALPNLEYIEDRMTPEGLVKHLNRTTLHVGSGTATIQVDSNIFIYEDELESLFGHDRSTALRMMTLLTRCYGCPSTYMHTTATGGKTEIKNPCFVILSTTAPEGLSTIPAEASGGLLGRLIIVSSGQRRAPIAWPKRGPSTLRQWLIDDLVEIAQLRGVVTVTDIAKELFRVWYEKQVGISFKEKWIEAFHERCHDTARKIAILLSVSRSESLILNEAHMEAAIRIIEDILPQLRPVGVWLSSKEFGQLKARVEELVTRMKIVDRADVLRTLGCSAKELDEVQQTLEQQNFMRVTLLNKKLIYEKL